MKKLLLGSLLLVFLMAVSACHHGKKGVIQKLPTTQKNPPAVVKPPSPEQSLSPCETK